MMGLRIINLFIYFSLNPYILICMFLSNSIIVCFIRKMSDRVSYACKNSDKTLVRVFRCDIPLRFADKCALICTLSVDTIILAPVDREVVLIIYIYIFAFSYRFCIGIGKIKQVVYV